MIPKRSIQPMELVISAIHCLKDRKGSSPKEITKYLEQKYNVCTEALRAEVESGLKKGMRFGLINKKSGLYRLNDILSPPLKGTTEKLDKLQKSKKQKHNRGSQHKRKLGKVLKKSGKQNSTKCALKKRRRNSKGGKKIKQKKTGIKGQNSLRQNDVKRKSNRQKSRAEKAHKVKTEKVKKLKSEELTDSFQPKTVTSWKLQSS